MAKTKREAIWKKCNGEAHSNFHIDHCMVCLPWWMWYPTCSQCGRKLSTNFTCRPCHRRYAHTDQPREG